MKAKTEKDKFRAKYFHSEMERLLPGDSNHARELFVKGLKKFPRKDGSAIKPGQLDKYKRGENVPMDKTIDKYEGKSGYNLDHLRRVIHHSFWDVIDEPILSLDKLYPSLLRLKPNIRDLLFYSFSKKGCFRKSGNFLEEEKYFAETSDLDSLTACIGLMHECRLQGDFLHEYFAIRGSFFIFTNILVVYRFNRFAKELFDYMQPNFFYSSHNKEWSERIKDFNFEKHIWLQETLILIAEDIGLLKYYNLEEYIFFSSIYGQYINESNFPILINGSRADIYKIPEIKNLAHRLDVWRKQNPKSN